MSQQAKVYHAHLWGARERKYASLPENDLSTTEWTKLTPQSPFYLFTPARACHPAVEAAGGWD